MGERFSMRVTVGGDLHEDKLPDLIKLLDDANPYVTEAPAGAQEYCFEDLPDKPGWLRKLSADKPHIELYENEGSWHDWDTLTRHFIELGLSYDFACDPKYEYAGVLEVYRPGQLPIQTGMESEGQATVRISDVRDILCGYIVSQAELRRALDRAVPETDLPMASFRVIA